jgi:hypothetical protein
VGLRTADRDLIERALRAEGIDAQGCQHIMAAVCPEHVVAIYRGQLPGVGMAWRMLATNS